MDTKRQKPVYVFYCDMFIGVCVCIRCICDKFIVVKVCQGLIFFKDILHVFYLARRIFKYKTYLLKMSCESEKRGK